MSQATTVRISSKSKNSLNDLAKYYKTSHQKTLEKIVEEHKRKVFFDKVNSAYSNLQKNKKAWAEEKNERETWDNTLLDNE